MKVNQCDNIIIIELGEPSYDELEDISDVELEDEEEENELEDVSDEEIESCMHE